MICGRKTKADSLADLVTWREARRRGELRSARSLAWEAAKFQFFQECVPSLHVRRELQNAEPGHRRQPPIVCQERGASSTDRRDDLKRVGCLDAGRRTKLRGGSQLIVRRLDQPNPSAAGQQRFVTPGQVSIPSTIGHDEHFEQRQCRRDQFSLTLVGLCEERQDLGKESRVLFDEIDEDRRVDSNASDTKRSDQPDESRSAARARLRRCPANAPCRCGRSDRRAARARHLR